MKPAGQSRARAAHRTLADSHQPSHSANPSPGQAGPGTLTDDDRRCVVDAIRKQLRGGSAGHIQSRDGLEAVHASSGGQHGRFSPIRSIDALSTKMAG